MAINMVNGQRDNWGAFKVNQFGSKLLLIAKGSQNFYRKLLEAEARNIRGSFYWYATA
jgi:hypothetical protein